MEYRYDEPYIFRKISPDEFDKLLVLFPDDEQLWFKYKEKRLKEFGNNKIMFPSEEELARCEAFLYDENGTKKYDTLWSQIR